MSISNVRQIAQCPAPGNALVLLVIALSCGHSRPGVIGILISAPEKGNFPPLLAAFRETYTVKE
jgi:hypothetical protein